MKKIYLGADHAGFKLKEKIKKWLKVPFIDLGNKKLNPNDDYPDYAVKVAKKVVKEKSLGVLFCGSGQGMCIAANKIKGVRAVVPISVKEAKLSREDNDANILCLSGWYNSSFQAKRMVKVFLNTPFSKEKRHVRRINKIKKLK